MQCPNHALPEYAFIGRSNVGKSSLINALTHHSGLAKTSQKPGKTITINHFLITSAQKKDGPQHSWHLVDLPGYGYARAGKTQREKLRRMIERYCLLRQQLVSLFILIDVRHEPQSIDLEFIQWAGEQGIPFAIVFTKADKLSRSALEANVKAYKNTLFETWEELPPVFVTSSESRIGLEELTAYIEKLNIAE